MDLAEQMCKLQSAGVFQRGGQSAGYIHEAGRLNDATAPDRPCQAEVSPDAKLGPESIEQPAAPGAPNDSLLYVENLLENLSGIDPKFRTVVEGRVFLGMSLAEIGESLQCSERTAATYWSYARQWLADELDRNCAAANA